MTKQSGKQSARQRFIAIIEHKILSGELSVDEKLPPERELSEQTGISRTIVHAGLLELATKNVLRIIPRQGTYVNNFKKEGTLELYGALLKYTGDMENDLLRSLIQYREITEVSAAKLAAKHRTQEDMETLRFLLAHERSSVGIEEACGYDYQFHLQISKASGNIVLPMAMRSIEEMYISLVKAFYDILEDRDIVYRFHEQLVLAIENGNDREAGDIMKKMLDHGRDVLIQYNQISR